MRTVAFLALTSCVVGCYGGAGSGEPITATAESVLQAYTELRGDKTYKGKQLNITGTAGPVVDDHRGSYILIFGPAGAFGTSIKYQFAGNGKSDLATVKAGDTITVSGKCVGLLGDEVRVVDCRVVKRVTGATD